jgi:hypothetical protein
MRAIVEETMETSGRRPEERGQLLLCAAGNRLSRAQRLQHRRVEQNSRCLEGGSVDARAFAHTGFAATDWHVAISVRRDIRTVVRGLLRVVGMFMAMRRRLLHAHRFMTHPRLMRHGVCELAEHKAAHE